MTDKPESARFDDLYTFKVKLLVSDPDSERPGREYGYVTETDSSTSPDEAIDEALREAGEAGLITYGIEGVKQQRRDDGS